MRVILGEEVVELGGLVVEGAVGCRASRVRHEKQARGRREEEVEEAEEQDAKHGGKAGVAYGRSSTARARPRSATREEEAEEEQGEEEAGEEGAHGVGGRLAEGGKVVVSILA